MREQTCFLYKTFPSTCNWIVILLKNNDFPYDVHMLLAYEFLLFKWQPLATDRNLNCASCRKRTYFWKILSGCSIKRSYCEMQSSRRQRSESEFLEANFGTCQREPSYPLKIPHPQTINRTFVCLFEERSRDIIWPCEQTRDKKIQSWSCGSRLAERDRKNKNKLDWRREIVKSKKAV